MKACLITVLSLALVLLCCLCNAEKIPPQFEVDLDLPPRERWQAAYKVLLNDPAFAGVLKMMIQKGSESLRAHGCDENCVARINNLYKARFPEYYEELEGIAELAEPLGLKIQDLVMEQARYEFTVLGIDADELKKQQAEREKQKLQQQQQQQQQTENTMETDALNQEFTKLVEKDGADNELVDELQIPKKAMGCTSVLVCNKNNEVLHGRNLDWFSAPHFGKTMFRVNFMKNGEILYQSEQLVGLIGILTAVRPNGFSVSINARLEKNNPNLDQLINCMDNVSFAANHDWIPLLHGTFQHL